SSFPLAVSQRRTVASALPDTTKRPSFESAMDRTAPVCPRKQRTSRPVAKFHRQIVWSELLEIACCPSAAQAALQMLPRWPSKWRCSVAGVSGFVSPGGGIAAERKLQNANGKMQNANLPFVIRVLQSVVE